MANSFPQPPPTSSLHPTRLHCIFQTPHRDSFSTAARNPFLLASLAADTSSPLPGSFAPKTSLKEPAIPLPQTRSSPFPYHYNISFPRPFFLHILSFSPKTPHGRTLTMFLSLPNDASTNPQPQSLPCSPLSCLPSNWSLAFVPSSQVDDEEGQKSPKEGSHEEVDYKARVAPEIDNEPTEPGEDPPAGDLPEEESVDLLSDKKGITILNTLIDTYLSL